MYIHRKDLLPDYKQRLKYWYLQKWKGTQDQFAAAVWDEWCNMHPEIPKDAKPAIERNAANRWMSEKDPLLGLKYISAICKVLDIDVSEFLITTRAEKYKYSTEYADERDRKHAEMAQNNYKIDLTFFQGLRNIVPDFDAHFPFYAPLALDEYNPASAPYDRDALKKLITREASETTHGVGLFQLHQNGTNRDMNKYDMKLVKLLQMQMKRCYYAWCEAVSKKLDSDMAAVNNEFVKNNPVIRYHDPNEPLEMIEDDDKGHSGLWDEMTAEELQHLDPFGIYTDEEAQKYHLKQAPF